MVNREWLVGGKAFVFVSHFYRVASLFREEWIGSRK